MVSVIDPSDLINPNHDPNHNHNPNPNPNPNPTPIPNPNPNPNPNPDLTLSRLKRAATSSVRCRRMRSMRTHGRPGG